MKDVIKFFGFLLYTTTIFFLPNQAWLLLLFAFHILCMIFAKVSWKKSMIKTSKILPFILFTFIVNCLLDEWKTALWIGVKLLLVCHITVIYSETTSIMRGSRNDTSFMFATQKIAHPTRRNKGNGMYCFICYSNPKKGFNRGKRSLQSKENRVACKKYASHIR